MMSHAEVESENVFRYFQEIFPAESGHETAYILFYIRQAGKKTGMSAYTSHHIGVIVMHFTGKNFISPGT